MTTPTRQDAVPVVAATLLPEEIAEALLAYKREQVTGPAYDAVRLAITTAMASARAEGGREQREMDAWVKDRLAEMIAVDSCCDPPDCPAAAVYEEVRQRAIAALTPPDGGAR